jgi:holo-[acyl-carrier protein] synthase
MKILGVGIDIIKNKRIQQLNKNLDFKKRVFSKKEIELSKSLKNKTNYFSKRFAAKEAFAKAIGTGFRNNLNFKDIEIINNKAGKPSYVKTKKLTRLVKKNFKVKNFSCFLSISDEKEYSTAFVIIQST